MLPAAGATDRSVPTGAEATHSQDDSYYSTEMYGSENALPSDRRKVRVKKRKPT